MRCIRRQWGRSSVDRCEYVWKSTVRCSSSSALCLSRRRWQDRSTTRCYVEHSHVAAVCRCQAQTSRSSNLTRPQTCSGGCLEARRLFHLRKHITGKWVKIQQHAEKNILEVKSKFEKNGHTQDANGITYGMSNCCFSQLWTHLMQKWRST